MDKHPGGSCDAPSHFMLGILCDGLASRPVGAVILLVTLYWVSCDGLASYPWGSSDAPVPSCYGNRS